MKRQHTLLLGAIAGMGAAMAAGRITRARRAIDFRGRSVVITGASRGLGFVMARKLVAEGARVCVLARDSRELDRAGRLLSEERPDATVLTLRCDVRRRGEVRATVARILEEWTAIDVLINNAGVIQVGPFEHMQQNDYENAMATHFWGPLHLMLEVLPSMRRRGFGRIVNISSIGGRIGVPHLAPYCASKFALAGLSDSVRPELARYGIRVTTVSPGLMRTGSPINAQIKGQHDKEFAWFAIADALPGLSMSADRAAAAIIESCRYGDPALTLTMAAKAAILLNAMSPGTLARLTELTCRVLPGPTGAAGDVARLGRETESPWAPSAVTALSDRAAILNNEV